MPVTELNSVPVATVATGMSELASAVDRGDGVEPRTRGVAQAGVAVGNIHIRHLQSLVSGGYFKRRWYVVLKRRCMVL